MRHVLKGLFYMAVATAVGFLPVHFIIPTAPLSVQFAIGIGMALLGICILGLAYGLGGGRFDDAGPP